MNLRAVGCEDVAYRRDSHSTEAHLLITDEAGRLLDAGAAMQQLHRVTLRERSLHTVLQTLADLVTQVVPGSVEVSIAVLVDDEPCTLVHTGRLSLDLDAVQWRDGRGPSLHAARTGQAAEVVDARVDSRWPRYMEQAVRRGSLSSLSIGLGSYDLLNAGLNIYSRESAAISREGQRTAKSLARYAARALARMHAEQTAEELAANLQEALRTRSVLDHGRSVLVEQHAITPEESFRVLAHAAMRSGRKLRDVAEHVVRTGELPEVVHDA